MSNFTYLLGAGASAQRVPVVKDFGYEIQKVAGHLPDNSNLQSPYQTSYGFFSSLNSNELKIVNNIREDLLELAINATEFYSIDTLAKTYYLRNDTEKLNFLKRTLSIYLTLHQIYNGVDKRYDLFFASLLSKDTKNNKINELPENIKILSWNYDSQIEMSISKFIN